MGIFSPHFDRTDVETVVHSDSGFAAVSYLRIKGAILKEKSESGSDLIVPPLLEADFARIQALLRDDHFVDSSIHGVSEPVTHQPTVQSCSASGPRMGNWVAVGNIFCATGQDITFEKEVTQCFHDLQGSSISVKEMLF